MRTFKLISLVIPAYCEQQALAPCLEKVSSVLDALRADYEIIVVDDGSPDGTWEALARFRQSHPRVQAVRLSRNYGHQVALLAGLDHARGDLVITMDADQQHPAELIPAMLEQWRAGFDIVNMVKRRTQERGLFKDRLADLFYWFFNRIARVRIAPNGSDFRLLDRRVGQIVRHFRQRQFFLRGIVADVGFRHVEIEYIAPARRHGAPAYTLGKLIDLALRGLFSYSDVGLKAPLLCGLLLLLAAMGNVAYAVSKLWRGIALPAGWLSTYVLITLLFALVFVFVGIQGLYLSRILEEVRAQPLYTVDERTCAPGPMDDSISAEG